MSEQRTDLIDSMTSDLIEHIVAIRQKRRWIEDQWLRAHQVWMGQEQNYNRFQLCDVDKKYSIPFVRKAIERTITRASKMLLPKAKWYEVFGLGDVSDQKISNVDAFMTYILRKRIKSKTNVSQLVRSLVLYNRCHLKTSIVVSNAQVWPSQRVVDPFSLYFYPETAVTTEEADFIFEDFIISYERYRGFVKSGIVSDIEISHLTPPKWSYSLAERLSHQGIIDNRQEGLPTITERRDQILSTPTPFVEVTEVWLHREDLLYQAYIVWNLDRPKIVGFFASAYDEPMYKTAVHRSLPNEGYANSMMDDVVDLEGLANDALNKFQDAVDRERGIYGVDVSQRSRTDDLVVKGGAVWKFNGDPREMVHFMAPPNTSVNLLRAWQIYLGIINSMGATGTIAEGQPGRNMPRAGGAVNNLINLAMADTQDLSELIEQEVLTPALGDLYKVTMRFIPDEQLMRIPGGKALKRNSTILKKEDISGDYEFDWVGSLQFQDDQVRAQRMLIFLNMVPQLMPVLNQVGYTFNLVELIQNIWRYSLGERSLNKVIVPIAELQQTMSMEEVERLINTQVDEKAGKSIGGLNYNLPSAMDGFVQQS